MGLLSLGTPLPWEEAKKYADHVREHGIEQFLKIYHKLKNKETACLLWGDEVSSRLYYLTRIIASVLLRLDFRSSLWLSHMTMKAKTQVYLYEFLNSSRSYKERKKKPRRIRNRGIFFTLDSS